MADDKPKRLAERLRRADGTLLATEFVAFLSYLTADTRTSGTLEVLLQQERPAFRELPNYLASDPTGFFRQHGGFGFLTTEEQRVSFCYAAISALRGIRREQLDTTLLTIGRTIAGISKDRGVERVGETPVTALYDALIEPVVTYVLSTWDLNARITSLVLRYKQRAEWFEAARLISVVEADKSDVEYRLKLDFYRYLFDAEIDFVIDPVTPAGGGKPDVLAKLEDGRRLIVEAKVYDGKGRTQSDIKSGAEQAFRYAEQWGEASAFLVCFNTRPNSRMIFSGAQERAGLWLLPVATRTIYIISADLAIEVPASSATEIETVAVNLAQLLA